MTVTTRRRVRDEWLGCVGLFLVALLLWGIIIGVGIGIARAWQHQHTLAVERGKQ